MTDLQYEHLSRTEADEEHWFCPGCMPAAESADSLSKDSDEKSSHLSCGKKDGKVQGQV